MPFSTCYSHLGRAAATALVAFLGVWTPAVDAHAEEAPTVFRDYIERPDATFSWKIARTVEEGDITTHIIELVSQQWRNAEEVDHPVWRHWLIVARPRQVKYDTALLIVGGGSSRDEAPAGAADRIKELARHSNSVVAELKSVPNQPLVFAGHDEPLYEDGLLAYCMTRCIETGDNTWLPRLPMVKSVVRAMDAIEQALASDQLPEAQRATIKHFVIAGGSKRGWTTWLVPTVDKRVTAIMPMVIDVLNVRRSMAHHLAAYGKWSPALGDYERNQLLDKATMDRSHQLSAIDDPYTYRRQLELPKYIINASGDEFFVSDSSQFYFDDLVGEKHLRYVPNSGHSLDRTDVVQSILGFYKFILADQPRPEYQWRFDGDGAIVLKTAAKPIAVRHWQATNPDARDFRLAVIGPKFAESPLEANAQGEYRGELAAPPTGWTAHFVEAEFAGPDDSRWKVTSGVQVTPTTLPFAEKAKPYLEAAGGR